MTQLIAGIAVFFGIHSISVFALPLRDRLAAKSDIGWKLFYSVLSLIGLVLMIRGYAELRSAPSVLYTTPFWLRHVAAVLLLPVFILFFAPYFPGRIKTATKHPQLFAVILWSVSHLLINGMLADVLLFGSFLLWAIMVWASMSRRPTRAVPGAPPSKLNDIILVVIGLGLYALTIYWLHEWMTGIKPVLSTA